MILNPKLQESEIFTQLFYNIVRGFHGPISSTDVSQTL
jgi:hypothetical protein